MAVTAESSAPYAPASAIIEFITKYRNVTLPEPFNAEVLQRIGISDSLIPRTLQALETLDLMTADGRATDDLEALRLANTDEFQGQMAEWVRKVYADIFRFTDPSEGDQVKIRDAFRTYNPRGQQPRMVSLFIGLCKEAGIIEKVQPAKRATGTATSTNKATTKKQAAVPRKNPPRAPELAGLPPALAGLLHDLPSKGKGWTKAERDSYHAMLTALLDYFYPVGTKSPEKETEVQND